MLVMRTYQPQRLFQLQVAAEFYRRQGAEVIATNLRYPGAEADLAALYEDGTIAVCALRVLNPQLKRGGWPLSPQRFRVLDRAANRFLKNRPSATGRLDVVAIGQRETTDDSDEWALFPAAGEEAPGARVLRRERLFFADDSVVVWQWEGVSAPCV